MLEVSVTKLSPVLVELDVSVPSVRVKQELDRSFATLQKDARISGFRPGKAPRAIIQRVFGQRVTFDVAQRLREETFAAAVAEKSLQPISAPRFDDARIAGASPFVYKARFEILPEIAEVRWEGLTAKRPKTQPTEEAIQAELELLRRANSTLEPPAEAGRGSRAGDVVTVDFDVAVGGVRIDDAGARGFQIELGTNSVLPAFEEAILGKRPGDTASFEVPIGDTHPHARLRGQTAGFDVKVLDVKERVLPELDDEFAKDLGSFETLEDVKRDVGERLAKALEAEAESAIAEQLVVGLVKANPIPVPPSLVERQFALSEQEILARARREGGAVSGLGQALRAQVRADSELKVRAGLLMAELAKRKTIKIGEAEIEKGLEELAQQTGKNVAKLRAEYRDPKKRELLVGMILENQVLDIIQAAAKIEEA